MLTSLPAAFLLSVLKSISEVPKFTVNIPLTCLCDYPNVGTK